MELTTTVLFSLAGAIAVGLGLLLAFLRNPKVGLVVVGIMLFVTTLGLTKVGQFQFARTWLAPLQQNRTPLVAAAAVLLMLGTLVHLGRLSIRSVPLQGLFMLFIGLYAGLMRFGHEGLGDGIATMGLTTLIVAPMLLLIPGLLREWSDFEALLRTLVLTMIMWSAAVLVQVFINREMLFTTTGARSAYRFSGLTANPQAASILLSVTAFSALWIVLNTKAQRARVLAVGLVGASLIMLAWTGSRTGVAMFGLGFIAVLYARVGRSIFLLPVIAVVGYVLYNIAVNVLDIEMGLSRLASTEDTRSHVWLRLWEAALREPLVGVGVDDAEASENGYLYGFASYGVGMLLLLLAMTFVSGVQMLRLLRARPGLPVEGRALVDLVLGFNAAYFAGSMFEGYMIARISAMNILWLLFAAIGSRILEKAAEDRSLGESDEAPGYGSSEDLAYGSIPYGEDLPEAPPGGRPAAS